MDVPLSPLNIAEQLVSPSSILFAHKPKPQFRRPATLEEMDKRHPSSFQQLEKASSATPLQLSANILSLVKAHMRQ